LTHPTAIEQRQDGGAVEEAADTAAPHLAAIQDSYEEAKANIVDPSRSPTYPARECSDPHPGTEKIDVRAVKPPVPRDAIPGTAAMSVAARSLAEQLVAEEMRSSARSGEPPASAVPSARPRWWRALRTAMHDAVLTPRSHP
jgi:hypothetical protein